MKIKTAGSRLHSEAQAYSSARTRGIVELAEGTTLATPHPPDRQNLPPFSHCISQRTLVNVSEGENCTRRATSGDVFIAGIERNQPMGFAAEIYDTVIVEDDEACRSLLEKFLR